MKILTVAIPNHHFFQWVNQLKDSGCEVYWFDITDGGPKSEKIHWVTQIKGWKLKWDFPFRSTIKSKFPKLYKSVQHYNENADAVAFAKAYQDIQPDIVHCFEMQLAGLPILPFMQTVKTPFIYSSWGSDLYDFKRLGLSQEEVTSFLQRTDYLITDCNRDQTIAIANGFTGKSLGVFPGNGGLQIDATAVKNTHNRYTIMIKGYEDGVGKAAVVLKALTLLDKTLLANYKIVVYSADTVIDTQIKASSFLSSLDITVLSRYRFIKNKELLAMMGASSLHIANSISDGMPNALLEAMGMGAFPIQSNPGGVTSEVINDTVNGLLIKNPLNPEEIASHIKTVLINDDLRVKAQEYNITHIKEHYKRATLKGEIIRIYRDKVLVKK